MSSTDSCLQYRQLFRAQSAVYCNSAPTNTWRTHCTLFSAITHTSNAGCVIKQATVTWCFVKNSFLMSDTKLGGGVEFPKFCVKSVWIQTQPSPHPLATIPIPLTCVKCLRSTMPYVSVRKFRIQNHLHSHFNPAHGFKNVQIFLQAKGSTSQLNSINCAVINHMTLNGCVVSKTSCPAELVEIPMGNGRVFRV